MKLLIVLSRIPYPLEKGDKLRAYNQIKRLSKNHDIFLFALNDRPIHKAALEQLKPFCKSIKFVQLSKGMILLNMMRAWFSGLPLQVGYFYNKHLQSQFDEFYEKNEPDVIYCQLIRTAEFVKNIKSIPKALDYMDVFSKGVERWAKKASIPFRYILQSEYKRLLDYEAEVFNRFEFKSIISEQDRELIPHPDRNQIAIIKNGVDTDFFKPMEDEIVYDLLFSGNMNYPPNIDSALYLVNEIVPLVKQNPKYQNIKLLIAGATPHKKVLALKSENVTVSGWVEDIRTCFAQSNIFIAPMQLSIGLQNKILEAMAMKKPVIASKLANNAIQAPENDCILAASSTEEYVRYIIDLLENKDKADLLARNGYDFVQRNYNWETITEDLSKNLINISLSSKKN